MNDEELKLLKSIERTSKRTSKNMAFVVWLIILPWLLAAWVFGGYFGSDTIDKETGIDMEMLENLGY